MTAAVCVLVAALLVPAQGDQPAAAAAIRGLVTGGPQATPIAGARVSILTGTRQLTLTTDADGYFDVRSLTAGSAYAITVEAEGLRTYTSDPVVLRGGELRRIDIHMELEGTRYSMLVTGRAAEASSPEVSQTVDGQQIEALPSVTRTTTKYALLNPHARQVLGLGADFQDSLRLSINAGSYRHTGYMLDGASTYDWIYANSPQVTVPPGAVREVSVLTGQYSAQYGLSTTGVVSIATASGTDQIDGDVFLLVRPSGTQARPPLATFDVPNQRRDWGLNAGGALRKSRTFFFGSYERATQTRGAFIQSPRAGFFNGETHEQYGLIRVDHNLTPTQRLTARANASEYTTNNANDRVAGFNQADFGRRSHSQSISGQVEHRATFSGVQNQLRLSTVAYVPDSAFPLQPSVQVVRPNYATSGFSTSNWVHARTFLVGDQLSMLRGRHNLRIGGEASRIDARDYSSTPFGTYTFAPGPPQLDEHPLTYAQTFGTVDLQYGQTQASAYVEDEVKIASRMTVGAGLRYEVQSITDARRNFAPRANAAWDVTGNGRTIVRAGGGIFYDQYYMYLTRRFITLGPQSPQAAYSWSWGDPGFPTFPESFVGAPTGGRAGVRDIMIPGDRLLNPHNVQFSVGVERQLGRGVLLELKALQSSTSRQMRVNDINHPQPFERTAPGQVRTTQTADLSRPFTTYDGVRVRDIAKIENTAETTYRSLDVGLTSRGSRIGRFGVRYAWSSSTADSMFYADANSGVPNEWFDDWDRFEKGPSDFHQPHRLIADSVLTLPFQSQVAVVAVAASGLPVNPVTGRDNNGDSYTVDRPIGLARNSFRGPAQLGLDMAASKSFRLSPTTRVEARVEVFNAFNRRNFIKVNNIFGEGPAPLPTFLAPIAGITNTDPSRQVQFGLKFIF